MKKTYMIPEMELLTIEEEQALLAGSVEGFTPDIDETGGDGTDALTREYIFFE